MFLVRQLDASFLISFLIAANRAILLGLSYETYARATFRLSQSTEEYVTLQEYAFSPRAQPIELGSGESKEVVFEATRVAFRFEISSMDLNHVHCYSLSVK